MKAGYKQTEVGVIPEDWAVKRLGGVAPLKRGFDLPSRLLKDGPYPVVYSNGIVNHHAHYQVQGPGVVTGRSGTIGKVTYLESDFWPHNTALWVTGFTACDPKFVYFLYGWIGLERFASGSGVPTLNRNDVHDLKLAIPPIAEQKAIAEALSDADALIGSLEQLFTKKRLLKQGAMQDLLTGKRRLPGFQEEWEVKRLGDVADVRDGTHQTPKYFDRGIPFFSVENVTSGDFTNTKFISEHEHKFLTRYFRIERGDILMTRIGSIGDCKLIDWDVDASFYVSLALLKIREGTSPAFVCHFSNTQEFKREAELNSLQSAIPKKINLGPISEIRIRIPALTEQTAIAAILSDMDAEIAALETKLAKARQVKQGMMQELLTGRTRLV